MPQKKLFAAGLVLLMTAGCAHGRKKSDDSEASQSQTAQMQKQMTALTQRIDALETKLSAMNDKFDSTRLSLENFLNTKKLKSVGVTAPPADAGGAEVDPTVAKSDPEKDFQNGMAVQSYRKALVLFQARKYSEAILAFSGFLERYADHPLAGSAQYYIGECYFQEKEYKLADQELQRVLTSYDRSPHVADTLRRMVEAEEALKDTDAANHHRQMLTSLFPQSPAAAGLTGQSTRPMTDKTSADTTQASNDDDEMKTKAAAPSGGAVDLPPATAPGPAEGAKAEH